MVLAVFRVTEAYTISPMKSNLRGVRHRPEHDEMKLNWAHEKYFIHREISTTSPERARDPRCSRSSCTRLIKSCS